MLDIKNPMKFPRDICRLLGLGGDGPGEQEMEVQDGAPERPERRKDPNPSQAMLSGEEGLDEEERSRRRAERRRAKKKRQKERRKLEKEERMEDASEQEEDSEEEEKPVQVREEKWVHVGPRSKSSPDSAPAFMTTENKSNQQLAHRPSEEEPEWDLSSAFVAKAASHIKLKSLKSRASQFSRENKENEAGSSQVETSEEMKRRGEALTVQGIQTFEQGQYSQAVRMFTEAIRCDPKDHRFYGNRSYCYWCLEQYSSALADAQTSIQLAPDWPKGHFRKGCALMGSKQYVRAEEAMAQVLKLDPRCQEASSKLFTCRVLQLMELGFSEQQSELLLEKFKTVQVVINSSEAKTLKQTSHQDQSGSCRSLWVGNITGEVSEKHLLNLFKMFGEIESIRVFHERFCAFVNFKNANMAATALEKLQVCGGGRSRGCAPIDGDKCFYWQTTGCFYGDKCCFKHIPERQGRDKKP
ncbi:uncharacterized protein LOC141805362 isoform X2 [Halichoeres trimaculatus]|uniref:uncharacterized protein LOC141805362 isoform X2 n=1 Tax=Halichoeres trimaculatus TaxID=147232 RepID=UPI003D9E13AD